MKPTSLAILVSAISTLCAYAQTTCITVVTNGAPGVYLLSGQFDPNLLPNKTVVLRAAGSVTPQFQSYYPSGPSGVWLTESLQPGEGAMYQWGQSATNVTFCITNNTSPVLPLSLPAGYSLVCCQNNQTATFEDIVGRPPVPGTRVYRFKPGAGDPAILSEAHYLIYTYDDGTWSPEAPVANVGEALWVFQPTGISNMQMSSGSVSFEFLTPSLASVTVQHGESPDADGSWQPLTTFAGLGGMTNVVDSVDMNVVTQRFYRVYLHQ